MVINTQLWLILWTLHNANMSNTNNNFFPFSSIILYHQKVHPLNKLVGWQPAPSIYTDEKSKTHISVSLKCQLPHLMNKCGPSPLIVHARKAIECLFSINRISTRESVYKQIKGAIEIPCMVLTTHKFNSKLCCYGVKMLLHELWHSEC